VSTSSRPSDVGSGRWRLHPRVALRPEPFGALAYHYDNRKLNFLRSPHLVELVQELDSFATPRAALDELDLDRTQWKRFARALDALAASGFLQPSPTASTAATTADGFVRPDRGTTP